MEKGAVISEDNLYRYALWRIWDKPSGLVTFIALNPSTADDDKDDQTIKRMHSYTEAWGYGGFNVVNLFAYRSTDPNELTAIDEPIGSDNDAWIKKLTSDSNLNVVCWGNTGDLDKRDKQVLKLIKDPHCIDINKTGQPAHPLMLKESLIPKPYKEGWKCKDPRLRVRPGENGDRNRKRMNQTSFKETVKKLYDTVRELEEMFPGRHFTPDGHMIGSLGECLVSETYNLELMTASNKGYDAVTKDGTRVEIKTTQANSVAFRSEPQHAIVIKILASGDFEEIYNGPGHIIWAEFAGKKLPSNGQYQISLTKLKTLNEGVSGSDRITRAI